MSDVTLEGISSLIKKELTPLKTDITAIKDTIENHTTILNAVTETLASHTATLDAIAKNTQNWEAEKAALTGRMNRHEEVIKRLAIKAGLKLDWSEPLHQ